MTSDGTYDRRTFLRAGLALGGGLVAPSFLAGPARAAGGLVLAGRPVVTHGVQSGDVTDSSAIVWARADRPARMWVDVSRAGGFGRTTSVRGPVVTPDTDLTGKVRLHGLPAGEEVSYRVSFADLDDDRRRSEAVPGRLRTAPRRRSDISFLWSADIAGQGWGVNPDFGGYRIADAMRAAGADFFLCSGDTVYADGPLVESVPLPDGRVWHNLVTPEKSKVAETLDEFRGQFKYNFLADNWRAFLAETTQVNQWDDHEVRNNWFPGQVLDDARYTERRVDVLAARSLRAFHEYVPIEPRFDRSGRVYRKLSYGPLLDIFVLDMRSFRDANSPDRQVVDNQGILGEEQTRWLIRELDASHATWKVIASDMPLGLVVPDGPVNIEAVAQGDPGAPLGRELQIASVLSAIKHRRVRNVVWLTADVHYTAAHRYDPSRAAFTDFDPFWEFVSGPLNAGGFGPNVLDATFGPQAVFVEPPPRVNVSPAEGFQYFGQVDVDAGSEVMTVRLRGVDGAVQFATDIAPERGRRGRG
jgi:alkaline phosphatase D